MAYFLKTARGREERSNFLRGSNGNKGAIVGTASYTPPPINGVAQTPVQHGVMLIPASFKLQFDSNVFNGWDGPSSSSDHNAWTTLSIPGVGSVNTWVKLTLPANAQNLGLECVVDDTDGGYSAGCISLAAMTLAGGDNNLTITSKAATTATLINNGNQTTSNPARIVLRQKSNKQVLLTLNVIVQPNVNVTVDVFYAWDPSNSNSKLPSGFPQSLTDTTTAATVSANIIAKLNTFYNYQANVYFSLGNSYILNSFAAGSPFDSTTGLVDFSATNYYSGVNGSVAIAAQAVDNSTKHIYLFVVKGIHETTGILGSGYDYLAASYKPRSMVPALTNLNEFYIVCGHEIGRDLNLSSVDTTDVFQFDHGPWPIEFEDDGYNDANGNNIANQAGLLSPLAGPQQNPWIRHEDSAEANTFTAVGPPNGLYY